MGGSVKMNKRSERPVGKTEDVGYQIGVRKTIPVNSDEAWQFLTAGDGIDIWLGEISTEALSKGTTYQLPDGTEGEVRVFSDCHLRMSWHPPGWSRSSTIQLRVIPQNDKSIIAFHQEHLPGPEQREQRRKFYKRVLGELNQILAA